MPYTVIFKRSAEKALDKVPKKERAELIVKINLLRSDAEPECAKKLKNHDLLWRIRHGVYRAIYQEPDDKAVITIRKIGHRKNVYRNL